MVNRKGIRCGAQGCRYFSGHWRAKNFSERVVVTKAAFRVGRRFCVWSDYFLGVGARRRNSSNQFWTRINSVKCCGFRGAFGGVFRIRAKLATLPDVGLGRSSKDVSVLLVQGPSQDMLPGIDGIIGIVPLKARQVNFDFGENVVSWK